jgi:hypothetical protein
MKTELNLTEIDHRLWHLWQAAKRARKAIAATCDSARSYWRQKAQHYMAGAARTLR